MVKLSETCHNKIKTCGKLCGDQSKIVFCGICPMCVQGAIILLKRSNIHHQSGLIFILRKIRLNDIRSNDFRHNRVQSSFFTTEYYTRSKIIPDLDREHKSIRLFLTSSIIPICEHIFVCFRRTT